MSLPDRDSVAPAELLAYALIDWQRSQLVRCPTCGGPGLVADSGIIDDGSGGDGSGIDLGSADVFGAVDMASLMV